MRVTIVYASIYGNTRQLATAMADALVADDHDVRLLPAGSPDLATLEGTELLLVGAPTQIHGWQLPVRDFLDSISRDGPAVPAAGFDTRLRGHTWATGSAAIHIAKSLRAARCPLVAEPASFIVEAKEGPLAEGEEARAVAWATDLARTVGARRAVA